MTNAAARVFQLPELLHILTDCMGPKDFALLLRISWQLSNLEQHLFRSLGLTHANLLSCSPANARFVAKKVTSVYSLKLRSTHTAYLNNNFLALLDSTNSVSHEPWYTTLDEMASFLGPVPAMGHLTRVETAVSSKYVAHRSMYMALSGCHIPRASLFQDYRILQANVNIKCVERHYTWRNNIIVFILYQVKQKRDRQMATMRILELYQRSLDTLALPTIHKSDPEAIVYAQELRNTIVLRHFELAEEYLAENPQPYTWPPVPVGPRPGVGQAQVQAPAPAPNFGPPSPLKTTSRRRTIFA